MSRFAIGLLILSIACTTKAPNLLGVGIPLKLATYRAKQVSNVNYDLRFELPAEKSAPINSELLLTLTINDLSQPLYLDFNEEWEHIFSLAANGETIPIDHQQEHLIISSDYLQKGENEIFIKFQAGELSLNRNEDFMYTLLVPDRASTLFPCFDQPNIKATYDLTVTAPSGWEVSSASPLKSKAEKDGNIIHQFETSAAISTYLFSFVAGDFKTITKEGSTLLYKETDQEKIEESIQPIFDMHKQSVVFLEEYTKYPFPFPKLDFATVPGFQYGGMEHVGAIQYRESTLFLDKTATESQKLRRGKLIAHETAHMWFGDLVTMQWFDDVWLKEVFANFMADKIVNPTFPDINHNLQFLVSHYPSAYSEDRTLGTNPIKQNLDNLKDAGSLYGRIIYNKAPIMMRQLEALIGEEPFQEGVQKYLKAFEFGNADWTDLIQILDSKTPENLKRWSEVWVNQSGRPIISEDITYDDNGEIAQFVIHQAAEDGSDKIWTQRFSIGLIYPDTVAILPVSITGAQTDISEAQGLSKPAAIIYNYDGFGYGVFPSSVDNRLPIQDEVARAHWLLNIYENAIRGDVTPDRAISLFLDHLRVEENELIARLLTRQINHLFWKYIPLSERDEMQIALASTLKHLLTEKHEASLQKSFYQLYANIAYSDAGKEDLYQIWKKEWVIPNLQLNQQDRTSLATKLAVYQHTEAENILKSRIPNLKPLQVRAFPVSSTSTK